MSDPRLRVVQRGGAADEAAILGVLDDRTIVVRLPAGQPAWRHQVLGLAVVDLLSRVFARIRVDVDADACADERLPPGSALLAERFAVTRTHGTTPVDPGEPALTIAIGQQDEPAHLHVDGAEWQSYLGTERSRLTAPDIACVPIGPLLAAARGAAHAFTFLMRDLGVRHAPPEAIYASALGHRTAPNPLDEPVLPEQFVMDAIQVGAGSVGGAADYAFARTHGLQGELAVIDPQALEPPNACRAILAPSTAAAARLGKAAVAEAAFEAHELDAVAHDKTVQEWLTGRPREAPLPLVLCAVDSAESRRAIQDCLPRELINAACHPTEVTASRHTTGKGPCVCCLHMADVLDGERIKARMIAKATGFNYEMTLGLMINPAGLSEPHLRFVERHNGMASGALQDYLGRTLEELYDRELMYGTTPVQTPDGGIVAVAAPWVTALAGFLLAAEALKASGGDNYAAHRLGDAGPLGTKVEEAVYASPEYRFVMRPPRWAGSECLCRSPRRARLIVERYGLDADEFDL